ncbi:hypothetical protein LJC30_00540 [Odoribacter sp. OttesenSCG-928-L07]|nr:hypothetical protein [Odoribacter sp. OttesenSCG-928-L07]
MKNFKSKPVIVERSAGDIYEKFTDFNNFKGMLPPDKVERFECTATECTFSIKGAPDITLIIAEAIPNKKIVYGTKDQKPLDLQFGFDISSVSENSSELVLYINAGVDGFMATMISKPLQNLVDTMAEKIENKQF